MTPEEEVEALTDEQLVETLRDYKGHAAPRCLRDKAATLIEQQATEIDALKLTLSMDSCANSIIAEQAKEIEELEKDLKAAHHCTEHWRSHSETLRAQNERLEREVEKTKAQRDRFRAGLEICTSDRERQLEDQNDRLRKALEWAMGQLRRRNNVQLLSVDAQKAKALLAGVKLTPPASTAPSPEASSTSLSSHQASVDPAE